MPTAIPAALLHKRGTGNLTMAQIKELLDNPGKVDGLLAALEKSVQDSNDAEKSAMAKANEAEGSLSQANEARAALMVERQELQDERAAFTQEQENKREALRVEIEKHETAVATLASDRKVLGGEQKIFSSWKKATEDRLQKREDDIENRETEATRVDSVLSAQRSQLDTRVNAINSAAGEIAAIAAKLAEN